MNDKQIYYLSQLQTIAEFRGGKYLSGEYVNNRAYLEWQCAKGHIWKAKGNKIQQGRWCPYCAGQHRNIKYVQDIAQQHGGEVLDYDFHGMATKYLWRCKEGHEWKSKLDNVVHLNRWCPHCAGNARLTMKEMHDLAAKKNGKCLSDNYKSEGDHLLWECSCGYQWECTPKNIKKDRWCPKCSGHLSPTIEEAQKIAMSRGGKLLSVDVKLASDHLDWQCDKGHVWEATWSNVKSQKSWCPYCVSFYKEEECREILEGIFGKSFPKNRKVLECRLELDGYCEELKLAYEYNGRQHYKLIPYWHRTPDALEKQQARDDKKVRLCEEKGIRLIVIPYTENHRLEEFIGGTVENMWNKMT